MTPEARNLELEEHKNFSDMRCTPTHHWVNLAQENDTRPTAHFYHIARQYGIRYRPTRLGPAAAVEHFRERLRIAQAESA